MSLASVVPAMMLAVRRAIEPTADSAIEALARADEGWISPERDRLCNDPRLLRRLAREADARAGELDAFGLAHGATEWRAIARQARRMVRNLS